MAFGVVGLFIIVLVVGGIGLAAFAIWASGNSKNKEDRE